MEQLEEQKQITIIERALLVEDYEPCQRFMSVFLQILGYQVDLVDDGFTAIENIASESLCSRKISAILTPKLIRITRLKLGRDVLRPARTGPF